MNCWIPCVGISFNETGEYLATIHKDQRGIYIWANKALFMCQYSNVFMYEVSHYLIFYKLIIIFREILILILLLYLEFHPHI